MSEGKSDTGDQSHGMTEREHVTFTHTTYMCTTIPTHIQQLEEFDIMDITVAQLVYTVHTRTLHAHTLHAHTLHMHTLHMHTRYIHVSLLALRARVPARASSSGACLRR